MKEKPTEHIDGSIQMLPTEVSELIQERDILTLKRDILATKYEIKQLEELLNGNISPENQETE